MEIFVDFGLFELLAAIGLAALARQIYTRRWLIRTFLALSLLAPLILVFFGQKGWVRWIAVVCLALALQNAALIFSLLKRGNPADSLVKQMTDTSRAGQFTSANMLNVPLHEPQHNKSDERI